MKKIIFTLLMTISFASIAFSQANVNEKVTEVSTVMEEQLPALQEFAEKLEIHKKELEERAIVLKYHKGNKEVTTATNEAVNRIEDYNNAAKEKVSEFESVWYDQTKNLIAIYTRYGELRESTGGGATELDDFVSRHSDYMDLMELVRTDLQYIAADCSYLRQ